jgi:hypothetical protein
MDKLATQLREDANRIDCEVSAQLDDRIRASLESMQPDAAQIPRRESKSPAFWWASSLTGIAAAAAVIVFINVQAPAPGPAVGEPVPQALQLPAIEWHAQAAVLTSPLEQEYENLQADLKKAEEAVKQDIDRLF